MARILVINPGSTSTKIAVYDDEREIFSKTIEHSAQEIAKFDRIIDQYEFRKELVEKTLEDAGIPLESIDAIAARGGNMKPVPSGTFEINDAMIEDLKVGVMGQHPSNLGGVIAKVIADKLGIKAYVVDPVVVDEMDEIARVTGLPQIKRKSKDHPLNQKAVARKAASELGISYEDGNFIVAHMGGGISVGAHKKGKMVDVTNALDGDGAFTPERSQRLPSGDLVRLCFSGKYTEEEVMKMLVGRGGLVAHLGTNDAREIRKRIEAGDEKAKLIFEAMAYNIAKDIGAMATVLEGDVDAIVLTGGLARDGYLMKVIKEMVSFIAPTFVYPGGFEMEALRDGVLRVLRGVEEAKVYK